MTIAELVFLRNDKSLLRFRLDRTEVCIGSHPTCDVVVPDPTVPEVAAILRDQGTHRFLLRDLTGGNLRVNNSPMDGEEIELQAGDTIGINPYSLTLQVRDVDAAKRQRFGHTQAMGHEVAMGDPCVLVFGGQRIEIPPEHPFNIGGHEDNALVIEDDFVSSFHCRITNQNGRWFISDLDSTNGTEVNGLRVREAELPIPATIKLGSISVSLEPKLPDPAKPRSTTAQDGRSTFRGMIGKSPATLRVFELAKRLAGSREPVLVLGDSGCGKELVARALHEESARSAGPFLALNCGALTSALIEGELFGHVKGAFTGALADKPGAFEATDGGTLFLDEIGEFPLELQPKLLRVLESGSVRRVGGTKEKPVSTRIVAATHRNLEDLVQSGHFREDLFHRLFVLSISIPPLKDRSEDILPLAEHFLESQSDRALRLTPDAEQALNQYSWPGNVRELRNVIVRAILMTDGDEIGESDLQFSRAAFTAAKDARRSVRRHDEAEREEILETLERTNGNRAEAARSLGLSKSTFHDRLKRHGIPLKFKSTK